MKLGMWFANVGPWAFPEHALTLLRAAEASGYDSLWTGDHPVMVKGYTSRYPYSPSGRLMLPEETPLIDSFAFLAWAAAHSDALKLCTGVLVLPHRNPVLVAKQAASVDALSGGRMVLGVGIGWMREEYAALGASWSDRAERLEEGIAVMRALWTQSSPGFDGRYHAFEGACSYPQPAAPGGVPVVVGGSSLAAARRAGRLGDGYFGLAGGDVPLERLLKEVRAAAVSADRDPDQIEVSWGVAPGDDGSLPLSRDDVERYAELGVSRLIVPPVSFDPTQVAAATEQFVGDHIS
ncbi:TIGR03619 family F420-dependent LLM class oxidoreductase [Nitriliruptor alkaliphilus]|uniref:TIGR03619 family F420-dependent LLM class oxidoreductase n=1 Tax=Nitriliruptor alkaliphilus TaxID=427918 RepID=UPI000697780F|nr:TIGR03619 family F420-dependent LLM class oxidoreductase [Nitriliruptor alkaliphilus]